MVGNKRYNGPLGIPGLSHFHVTRLHIQKLLQNRNLSHLYCNCLVLVSLNSCPPRHQTMIGISWHVIIVSPRSEWGRSPIRERCYRPCCAYDVDNIRFSSCSVSRRTFGETS